MATPRPLYSHGRASIPIVEKSCWTPKPFWTGVEKRKSFAPPPTGVYTPDRPASSVVAIRTTLSRPLELVLTETCFMRRVMDYSFSTI